MKIKREALRGIMQQVVPLVKSRTTMPILSCARLVAKDGRFGVMTSDMDCFVQASCDCEGDLEPIAVAPGALLALSERGPDTVELTLEKSRLRVDCGATGWLCVSNATEFPAWPSEGMKDLGVNPQDLAYVIESVAWASDPKSERGPMYRSVWVGMNTKTHSMCGFAFDGRRMGLVKKTAVVPNATVIISAEHATKLCEALNGDNVTVKTSDSWVSVENDTFRFACVKPGEFKSPVDQVEDILKQSSYLGELPKEEIINNLSTMRSVAVDQKFVYAKATFGDGQIALDYTSNQSEFHSVIAMPGKVPSPAPGKSKAKPDPNACAVATPMNTSIQFDASLLHSVLKNTPGQTVPCRLNGFNCFFESGDITTAVALLQNRP